MAELEMIDVKATMKDGTERVIAKQLACPADTPTYNPKWVSEREEYLFSKGWERDAASAHGGLTTYRDPKGSRKNGEITHLKDLPNRGDDLNPTKPLHQLVLPAASYGYLLEEAVAVQSRRDQAGEVGLTPLERLDIVEADCNNAYRDLMALRSTIKNLLINTTLTAPALRTRLRLAAGFTGDDPERWPVDPRPVVEAVKKESN